MPDYTVVLPSKPKVVSEKENVGIYEIEGLYPGFGHTIGNSLRRIILSSLPGAAVTIVKIAGVSHEFSTIEGVKEDVIGILLNLKKLRFHMDSDEPVHGRLKIKGPHKVTVADFNLPGQVEVSNKDAYICEVTSKNTELEMEITIEKGLGYVPKEVLHKSKVEIGTIALDATFTPIRKVNYEVENMRVGDRTDFNRLKIVIETDGIISPREALERSIGIMINQLKAVVGFKEEEMLRDERSDARDNSSEDSTDATKTKIEDLDLSPRIVSALAKASIRTVGGLSRKSEEDLGEIDGLGEKAIEEIKKALATLGVTLKA